MRSVLVIVLSATLLLAAPAALGEWKGRGYYEPDTTRDATGGWMHLDPDTAPDATVRKVYFNAYSSPYGARSHGNPNVAELGTSVMNYPTDIQAILGVWKDCNDDGYIGTFESALPEYPAVLLSDASICPRDFSDPFAEGYMPAHNDGKTIRELLVIGPDFMGDRNEGPSRENNTYPFNIADETARIWADFGLPESRTYGVCLSRPNSPRNLETTGGFLRWADCQAGWRITGTATLVGQTTGHDELRFDDAPRERPDQSKSILNQKNPYGYESDPSYVEAFDCTQPPTRVPGQRVDTPLGPRWVNGSGQGGALVTVYPPGTFDVDPAGSPAGTINMTEAGIEDCDRENEYSLAYIGHRAIDSGNEPSGATKTATDFYFEFEEGAYSCRAVNEVRAGDRLIVPRTEYECETRSAPYTSGFNTNRQTHVWFGLPGSVTRNPYVNRDDLQPWGAVHMTTYAKVDATTIRASVPSAVMGTYGSDHCSGTTKTTGWWECDPALWNVDVTYPAPQLRWQVKVGVGYNLLDIDCYDQSPARGVPVTSHLGTGSCQRP